jgi:MFS family permease
MDRRSAPGVLTLVFLVGTLTPLVYLMATSPWVVLLAGASDGFASAGVDLGWLTALLSYAPAGRVAHYVAIFNTLVGVRGSTAPLLAGLLVPRLGVRAIFALAAACTLSGAVLMRRVAREGAQPGPSR